MLLYFTVNLVVKCSTRTSRLSATWSILQKTVNRWTERLLSNLAFWMSAYKCHCCSSSVPSDSGSHGTPTWATNNVLLFGSSNTNQQENMLELKTMFISLDICKIWWHFCKCLKFLVLLQPRAFQSWKMGAAVFLPASTLDICLNQAVWKGRFCSCIFADMYSVTSAFHHFEKSIPVHLQHTFEEGGTGLTVPRLSYPAPRLRLGTLLVLTQLQPGAPCCTTATAAELGDKWGKELH